MLCLNGCETRRSASVVLSFDVVIIYLQTNAIHRKQLNEFAQLDLKASASQGARADRMEIDSTASTPT